MRPGDKRVDDMLASSMYCVCIGQVCASKQVKVKKKPTNAKGKGKKKGPFGLFGPVGRCFAHSGLAMGKARLMD